MPTLMPRLARGLMSGNPSAFNQSVQRGSRDTEAPKHLRGISGTAPLCQQPVKVFSGNANGATSQDGVAETMQLAVSDQPVDDLSIDAKVLGCFCDSH